MHIRYKTPEITVFESTLCRTTTTVAVTDDLVLVTDPNWLPDEVDAIASYVDEIRAKKPLYLLLTHSDYDHVLGYGAFPGAVVIASQGLANHPEPQQVVEQVLEFDDQYYLRRHYPVTFPKVDVVITKDGQTLRSGDTVLHFFLAPGHTSDGIFTLVEPLGLWLAGDYLSNIEFPFICDSSVAYEMTLDKAAHLLRQFDIRMMVPGHGDFTTDKTAITHRIAESYDYIRAIRKAVQGEQAFHANSLWKKYRFNRTLQRSHNDNLAVIARELEQG